MQFANLGLKDYPQAIAKQQVILLGASQHVRALQEAIAMRTAEIERIVAYDESLTNDVKRKAKRAELMEHMDYKAMQQDLQVAIDRRAAIEIDLNLLLNQFSVLKLEKREAIAQLESHIAA